MDKQTKINYIKKHLEIDLKEATKVFKNVQKTQKEKKKNNQPSTFKEVVEELKQIIEIAKKEGRYK